MLNQCNFIGRLGRDPEKRTFSSGDGVVNFTIACSEKWKDKQSGERKEKTEWVNVVAFRGLADICEQYLKKGSLVFISGKMQTRKWQDKEGHDRYSTEIVASEMQMLGGTGDSDRSERPAQDSRSYGSRTPTPAPQQVSNDFVDDDIPF